MMKIKSDINAHYSTLAHTRQYFPSKTMGHCSTMGNPTKKRKKKQNKNKEANAACVKIVADAASLCVLYF